MWITILFLQLLLATANSYNGIYDSSTCGRPSVLMQRFIRGGEPVKYLELPWSVRIKFALNDEEHDGDKEPFRPCSGTLISRKHVLTVAHCLPTDFKNVPFENVVELVGASANVDKPVTYRVKRVHMYEKYLDPEAGNDLALLELEEQVPGGIHHVCLPTDEFDIDEENDVIYLSGTGDRLDDSDDVKLMKVELGKRSFGWRIPEGEFVIENANNKSGCSGDSGGGATSIINRRHVLVGMHRGGTCSNEEYEGPAISLFTNVVAHIEQILEEIQRVV